MVKCSGMLKGLYFLQIGTDAGNVVMSDYEFFKGVVVDSCKVMPAYFSILNQMCVDVAAQFGSVYLAYDLQMVLDGAFGGVGDEEVVVGEGVVVTSSSLEMLTNSSKTDS
ncbi:hypothetical protein Tco_1526711 [Tanacetum coccineum]